VLISDITPGEPAEAAGVKLSDIVLAVDGRPVENLPMFTTALLTHSHGQTVKLDVLRGTNTVSLEIPAKEESHGSDGLTDKIDPDKNRIRQLGIVGIAIDKQTEALFPGLRGPYGVIVVAMSASSGSSPAGLQTADVIHEVNGTVVESVESLSAAMDKFKRGDSVALYIERDGKLQYLAFEME
jgi:serine protease Do